MPASAKSPSQSSQSSTADTSASTTSTAESELQQRLARQQAINDGASVPRNAYRGNIYAEFNEFTRKQIKKLQDTFKKCVFPLAPSLSAWESPLLQMGFTSERSHVY